MRIYHLAKAFPDELGADSRVWDSCLDLLEAATRARPLAESVLVDTFGTVETLVLSDMMSVARGEGGPEAPGALGERVRLVAGKVCAFFLHVVLVKASV